MLPRALTIAAAIALIVSTASAESMHAIELGGGLDFAILGSYDVGESLGGMAERNDLGPGTLGLFVIVEVPVAPALRIGGEAGLAAGGLVRTDERYFGMASDVGSTL